MNAESIVQLVERQGKRLNAASAVLACVAIVLCILLAKRRFSRKADYETADKFSMERLFLEERIGMIPMRGLAKLQDPCILHSIYEPSEIHREYYKFDAASMAESGEACVMRTEHNDRFLKVVFSRSESSAASYNVTVQFNGEVYAMQWKPCGLRNQKIIAADGWSVQLTDRMLE